MKGRRVATGMLAAVGACLFLVCGCQQKPAEAKPSSAEAKAIENLQRLKDSVATGDLVVRLGDDYLSYQIKFLNEREKDYSHAGMVVEKQGKKWIAHISPDEGEDGVRYTPIDSFLNPQKNLSCAAYRYPLTPPERDSCASFIERCRAEGVRFDGTYEMVTDSLMYCSEMIAKALSHATQNRLQFNLVPLPKETQSMVYRYFNGKYSKETIAARRVITLDNLYRQPQCRLLLKFGLKTLPGQ